MSDSNLAKELDAFIKENVQQDGTQKSTSTGDEHLNTERNNAISKMAKLGKCTRSSYYNRLICKGFLSLTPKAKSLWINKSKHIQLKLCK